MIISIIILAVASIISAIFIGLTWALLQDPETLRDAGVEPGYKRHQVTSLPDDPNKTGRF